MRVLVEQIAQKLLKYYKILKMTANHNPTKKKAHQAALKIF